MKIAIIGPGAIGCLSGQANLFTVVANDDAIVMKIPKAEVHQYLSINPVNAEAMLRDLSKQTAMPIKHLELMQRDTQPA